MRIKFSNQRNPAEKAEYDALLQRIDAWWNAFQQNATRIVGTFAADAERDWLPEFMHRNLGAVDPRLRWEFGPAVRIKGHRLVITPESDHFLHPLVSLLISRQPESLKHEWEFYCHRLPESPGMVHETVQGRVGISVSAEGCEVRRGHMNRIDLKYHLRGGSQKELQHAAFVATETLLGERILDDWIGAIEADSSRGSLIGKLFKPKANHVPLDRLKPTVDAMIRSIQEQLPDAIAYRLDEEKQVSLLEVKTTEVEDYAQQDDLFIAVAPNVELFKAVRMDSAFASVRFAKSGECFCYLKTQRTGTDETAVKDRARIEDAINAELPREVGFIAGAGTGRRYFYIELVLARLPKAIDLIRKALQPLALPTRSWILFHDASLGDEWMEIYPDSPPPPPPSRE